MAESNQRCEIVRLGEPAKHPNADTLEIFKVFDWDVVAKQGLWRPGDLAAYVVPDSVVDTARPEFSFINTKGAPGRKHRVKVIRLRGVYSQGLLIPPPTDAKEGDDVAAHFGIERFDPAEPVSTSGDSEPAPPGCPPVYDIESFRRYSNMLQDGEMVFITEKIHGANGRWTWRDGRLYCGSRTCWKVKDEKSIWWKVVEKYPQLVEFLECHPGVVVYGEVYGQVQDLKYGRTGVDLAAFDDMFQNGEFLDWKLARLWLATYEIPTAPLIAFETFDREKAKQYAEGQSMIEGANHVREGCVIRPASERVDVRLGRTVLKIVGNGYLERA